MNKLKTSPILLALLIFLSAVAAWLPWLLFPFAIVVLLAGSMLTIADSKAILAIALPFVLLAILLMSLAEPSLRYAQSDFVSYYNNYLSFLPFGYAGISSMAETKGFAFGGGLEAGVPILHFIFAHIIQTPAPFVVKLFHILLLETLLMVALYGIAKNYKLNVRVFMVFLCFVFVFIKFGGIFNHLRQSYASLIMLIALFSESRSLKKVLFAVACSFHLSSLILYPFYHWLLFSRVGFKKIILLVVSLSFLLGALIPFVLEIVVSQFYSSSVADKILWSFFRSQEEESVENHLSSIATRLAYLVPIIVFCVVTKTTHNPVFKISILTSVVVLSFWFLPSLLTRVFQIIFLILMGYLYFMSFGRRGRASLFSSITVILFLCAHMILWSSNVFYFYEFPEFSSTPFSYVSLLTEESYFIDRWSLPSYEVFVRSNSHEN
jgi:hypothetical protein